MSSKWVYASAVCLATYAISRLFTFKRSLNMTNQKQRINLLEYACPNKQRFFPIVYHDNYDIGFYKLESLHHFDTHKWKNINNILENYFQEKGESFDKISPLRYIENDELEIVHTRQFIKEIHESKLISQAAEIFLLRCLPSSFLVNNLVTPFKWQTSGSILAAYIALKHGWAINLGGGFHHASAATAEGFCFFADITLIIKYLWQNINQDLKFMIVDLDAHQGNGYGRDKLNMVSDENAKVYIFDMYNKDIYPHDNMAKVIINKMVEIDSKNSSEDYMFFLKLNFEHIFNEFKPDLIIYNAGTDILANDLLGHLNVSHDDVIKRDEYIFTQAKNNNIPIVMLTSGGYQKATANLIAQSIINLFNKKLINHIENYNEIKANL